MINYSVSTLALINALDYGELICSVYDELKVAVAQALKEKRKARAFFCDAVGMVDDGSVPAGVGVVAVMKGKRALQILDGDLWLEAIDSALLYMRELRSPACADALVEHYLHGKTKMEAAGALSLSMFSNQYCSEFRYALAAEAAARGLVDLKQK